jgi:peroxiredoxin Q/BCP
MTERTLLIGLVLAAILAGVFLLWRSNGRIGRNLPRVGDVAPSFALPDQNGVTRTLDEFRGHWLVLYFYPRDDTPGCTEQAGRYRDAMRDIEALGARVCGISVDDTDSHANFSQKYKLPFTLLADAGGSVAARYGSLRTLGFLKFARRNTFIINPAGRIRNIHVGVSAARDTQIVLAELRSSVGAAIPAA